MENVIKEIQAMASRHLWFYLGHNEEKGIVSFKRRRTSLDIYYRKMIVSTRLNHPKHGRTKLNRPQVDMNMLEQIFANPRVHTEKGHYVN